MSYKLVDKTCNKCGAIMINVSSLKLYCDNCIKINRRLSNSKYYKNKHYKSLDYYK